MIESGGTVVQETRLYDPDKDETRSMRGKEDANDYRYFPDPDLLPVAITEADLDEARAALPELPEARKTRFISELGLSDYDAEGLTADRAMADYFETAAEQSGDAKLAANWVMGGLSALLNKHEATIADSPVTAEMMAGMLKRVLDNTISKTAAKDVLEAMWAGEGDADAVIEAKGLKQVTDTGAIEALVDDIIAKNPSQVEEYRSGKEKVFGFFVGQTMRASKGKADPALVNQLLKEKLKG